MIQLKSFTVNPFSENMYVLYDETGECAIIDPGVYEPEEEKELKDFILTKKLVPKYLLNTHCHIDHVLGNYFVSENFHVKLQIPALEVPVLKAVSSYKNDWGFFNYKECLPEKLIQEGDVFHLGKSMISVFFTPGHSPGHVVFYIEKQKICIGGDVLFRESIGRTDLPGGDYMTLINSIKNKLYPLGDEVTIYPGHGPETTIGYEKKFNPFVNATSFMA